LSGAPAEPVLAAREIQGNVLPGFNTPHQALLGIRFDAARASGARRWLASLLPSVSTLAEVNGYRVVRRQIRRRGDEPPSHPVWLNVAFDHKGLAVLAPDTHRIRDVRFRAGMGETSNLGDPRDPAHPGHPSRWVVGGSPERTPEALLVVACDRLDPLRAEVVRMREAAEAHGLTVDYEQEGRGLDGEIEHFGFRDGISSPGARGRLTDADDDHLTRRTIDPSDERALRFGRPGQPLVWPGQFVFGYPRQRPDDPVEPGPLSRGGLDWMDNGSFLVFRRLGQDVAAFRDFLAAEASRLRDTGLTAMTPDRLAALLVGRWPAGTALVRNPAADPDPMADRFEVNHFGYAEPAPPVLVHDDRGVRTAAGAAADRLGRVCPAFSHIRKVNPRDLPTDKGGPDRTLTFAVLRRGIPWGDPYPATEREQATDSGDRGLLFLCYQTSIKDQFEVLNTDWMNRVHGPEGDAGQDLLVGQGSGPGAARERSASLRAAAAGGAPTVITTLSEWVTPTGGGYFFAPSLGALRLFANEAQG
jgi:Dyp-type peroxidase family